MSCSIGAIKNNNIYFMGSIVNDKYKDTIKNFINKYNIKTNFIQNVNKPTTIAEVNLDINKDRNFIFERNSDSFYKINIEDIKQTDKIDFIHFGSATAFLGGDLTTSYDFLFKYALNNKILFSFDPNFRDKLWITKEEIKQFIKYCQPYLIKANLIKLSEDKLYIITVIEDQIKAIKFLSKNNPDALITVSRGSKDTLFIWQKIIGFTPVIKSKNLKDTTGAGDAFISKLIDEFVLNNISSSTDISLIQKIIYNSNLFASKSVEYIGAITFLDYLN